MVKKRTPAGDVAAKSVTRERAARLYRLLTLLKDQPQSRGALLRRLRLDVRGFYRDLELLRDAGIRLELVGRRYTLRGAFQAAIGKLPFPDPHLTLDQAILLARGRSSVHRRLRAHIAAIVGARRPSR